MKITKDQLKTLILEQSGGGVVFVVEAAYYDDIDIKGIYTDKAKAISAAQSVHEKNTSYHVVVYAWKLNSSAHKTIWDSPMMSKGLKY